MALVLLNGRAACRESDDSERNNGGVVKSLELKLNTDKAYVRHFSRHLDGASQKDA
jgi:hypothetical protein